MDVTLILTKGTPKGKQISVKEGTTIIGRKEDSGLIIASTRVSRHHSQLTLQGNDIKIEDLGSANGTIVNGQRITRACSLKAGDQILIGPLGFLVQIDGRRTPGGQPSSNPASQSPVQNPPTRTPPQTQASKPIQLSPKPPASKPPGPEDFLDSLK